MRHLRWDASPFRHSQHLALKSLYATKANAPLSRSTERQVPAGSLPLRPHTHDALDDAIEQAGLFQNSMRWEPGE